jgi:hypothetical protein
MRLLHSFSHLGNSSSSGRRCNSSGRSAGIAVHFGLGAVTGDVTGLAAAVAGLACSVERAAIGSSAVARDVSCPY